MVKTLKEMGIKLGESLAKEKCLEDMKTYAVEIAKLKKKDVEKMQDLESEFKKLQVSM